MDRSLTRHNVSRTGFHGRLGAVEIQGPKSNFEINGALGIDNPFAGELRLYNANTIYPSSFTRNLSPLVNFIYQIRSDILFSTEYRYLNTSVLDNGSVSANHVNLSLGYIF